MGLYAPFSELPVAGGGCGRAQDKDATLAYGVALELGRPDKVSFRLNVLHATESEVPVADVGCQADCARSTVSTATATFALRPIPSLILFQPFLLVGGGVKRYDFTRADLQNEGLRSVFNDQNQLTGHLGVGVELNLGLVRLTGEVSDLLSPIRYGGRRRRDRRPPARSLLHDRLGAGGLTGSGKQLYIGPFDPPSPFQGSSQGGTWTTWPWMPSGFSSATGLPSTSWTTSPRLSGSSSPG